MPIPNAVSTRLVSALTSVDATTSLDLLISLIDVGQRSGLDISAASAELVRRANLVDSNTSSIEASKIAAGLFKIDFPVTDLWAGSSTSSGGHALGQLVNGYFGGNPKYVPANGSRYLVSAYPDMAALLTAGATPTFYEPISVTEQSLVGLIDNNAWRDLGAYVDGDVMMVPQQPTTTGRGFVLSVTTDGGTTWKGVLPNNGFTGLAMPEANSSGFSEAAAKQILGICKLDNPGQYGAIIANALSNAKIAYITTDDYGLTWRGWTDIVTGQSPNNALNYRLYYRNGVLLYIGNSAARYSTNAGQIWTTLSDTSWTANIATIASFVELSSDGFLTYTNNTTSVIHFQWPATPAAWASTLAWTTVASKFTNAENILKKCGNFWVAWNRSTVNIAISSTLTGTYTSQALSGITNVRDVFELNGVLYFLVNTSTGPAIFTATAALSITGTFAELVQTTIPSTRNADTNLRWPINTTKFSTQIGNQIAGYLQHGRESIAKLTAANSAGVTNFFGAHVNYAQPQFCRKYNQWFCSVPQQSSNMPTSWVNFVEMSVRMLHFRSSDGKNWIPIGTGFSGIIDAGSRLLRLNGAALLEQSTDGITWNTTGVTRPTVPASIVHARLWRVKDAIFYYATPNSSNSASVFYSSTNGGNTWTSAVSGITNAGCIASIKGGISFYQGRYFALAPYSNGDPATLAQGSLDAFSILFSTDAITWSPVFSTTISAGSYNYTQAGVFIAGVGLFFMAGAVSGSTQQVPLVTTDGRTFQNAASSNWTQLWSAAQVKDFDCSNGEMRWYVDKTFSYQSTNIRTIDVYRGTVLECSIISASQQLSNYTNIGGAEGNLMAVTALNTLIFSPQSTAFMVPLPAASTTVPLPFMRVAN